jgi:hypothetical protein
MTAKVDKGFQIWNFRFGISDLEFASPIAARPTARGMCDFSRMRIFVAQTGVRQR